MIEFLQMLGLLVVLHLIANLGRRGPAPRDSATGGYVVRPGPGVWLAGFWLPLAGGLALLLLAKEDRSALLPYAAIQIGRAHV